MLTPQIERVYKATKTIQEKSFSTLEISIFFTPQIPNALLMDHFGESMASETEESYI